MLHDVHTTGTNPEKVNFAENPIFWNPSAIFVGRKMCLVGARTQTFFCVESKMHISKNFLYYHLPRHKIAYRTIHQQRIHSYWLKLAILSDLFHPPPLTQQKLKKKNFFPDGIQSFKHNNFLDLCMKFFVNTFLGATLMYSRFLGLPNFAGKNKRFSAKIVIF